MSIAINSIGTLAKIGNGGSSETFATIPECSDVNAPDVKTDLNDVTSHDSSGGFREYLPGLHDGGVITLVINWVPSNAIHTGLREDAYASTKRNFETVFPDTSDNTVAYSGYVQQIGGQAKAGDPLKANPQVKVTGLPVWS